MSDKPEIIDDYRGLIEYSWFAVDKFGYIADFNNSGIGDIPDILKGDKEKYLSWIESLGDFFDEKLEKSCSATRIYISPVKTNKISNIPNLIAKLLNFSSNTQNLSKLNAEKGLFIYDVDWGAYCNNRDNNNEMFYNKTFEPTKPIHIDCLPIDIQEELKGKKLDISFSTTDKIDEKNVREFFSSLIL